MQVLFIQGGGEAVHDGWDNRLADSLRRWLGTEFEVIYPLMPDEANPDYGRWAAAIRGQLAQLEDGAVVVGHSIGGTILVNALAEAAPAVRLGSIILVAAPFVGQGGWPAQGFAPRADLGAALPEGVPVLLFHGSADDTAPPEHVELYAAAIPHAVVRRLAGRDHQLNDDLREVAAEIRALR